MINAKEKFINFLNGIQTPTYGEEIDNALSLLPIEQRQDFAQGLNGGNVNIAQKQKQLGISSPKTQEEIALAKAGQFNKPEMVRQGGLIQGYNQGYNLNYDNPTNTVGTRIGQAVGTLGRAIDTPLGRGLIAYGLSNAIGDTNPLEQAFTAGVGRQTNLTKDKVYRKQLKQLGMTDNEINSIRGMITDDIYKNIADSYKARWNKASWADLATVSPVVAEAVKANPELANSYLPASVANTIMRGDLTEAQIQNLLARTNLIKAQTKQVGKPKVTINRKEGGTTSTVNITHSGGSGKGSGGSGKGPDRPKKHKTNAF